ncbi:MAG TPA: hypothetical protein VM326_00615 [Sphingomicrobium sp.]|jgi:uncharacterized protein (TIGR02588 family)|nr:hypothetical protein [Sphingomicrobium sp.]
MAKNPKTPPAPLLEWVAAALGLAIAVALIGIIAREALAGRDGDLPVLAARVEGIEAMPGGQIVRVVVTNDSGSTAAAVEIEGKAGEEIIHASIDYVPGHGQARAALLFKRNLRADDLTVRVTGFQLP